MANEKTHADAVRFFLTGASSHDGAQTNPDQSLGNHKSSTPAESVEYAVSSPISGIAINDVARANGLGDGSLQAVGDDTVRWTPPGGTAGENVDIANGETKLIEAGNGEPDKFIRITRNSASALIGTATISIAEKANSVVAGDDVSSAEQASGDTEYRCFCLANVSGANVENVAVLLEKQGTQRNTDSGQLGASGSGTITITGSFADWPQSGFAAIKTSGGSLREVVYYSSRTATQLTIPTAGRGLQGTSAAAGAATDTIDAIPAIAIGIEAPASQPSGAFTDNTGSGEGTAPGGVSFSVPLETAEALSIGTLQPGYTYGIWIKRLVVAGMTAGKDFISGLAVDFDAV
ncbi:MAG: hypothetical protein ACPGXK_00250 [Phycisphaerae bacterium]